MAANPELKLANQALRAAHPTLNEEAMEPIYYRESLQWIRSHPVAWLGLEVRKLFYLIVPIGPSYRVHSPLYFWGSVVPYALLMPLAVVGVVATQGPAGPRAGFLVAARVGRRRLSRVLSSGAIPHPGDRPGHRAVRRRCARQASGGAGRHERRSSCCRRTTSSRISSASSSGILRARLHARAGRRRRVAGRHGRDRRSRWRRHRAAASQVCTARARADSGCRMSTGCARRSPPTPTPSARWTRTCRTIRNTCQICVAALDRSTTGDRLALSARRQRRELAAASHRAERVRQSLHPPDHRPAAARLHERLPGVAARGAGEAAARHTRAPTATRFSPRCCTRPCRRGCRIGEVADRLRRTAPKAIPRSRRACCCESLLTPLAAGPARRPRSQADDA